jgi:hypothetical protein
VTGSVEEERWWPVLFRGGVAVGECVPVCLPTIVDCRLQPTRCFIGEAVVDAVALEKRTKGPRILCSDKLQGALNAHAAEYVGTPINRERESCELYWPMSLFEDKADIETAINSGLREWFQGVSNLYAHFRSNEKVRSHYESYLRLLVRSAMQKYSGGRSALLATMRGLAPDLVEAAFF